MTATHEVFNQPPSYTGRDLSEGDPALRGIIAGLSNSEKDALVASARFWGSEEADEKARLANENTPVLHSHDRQGHRADQVAFHPAYHALMQRSIGDGLHMSTWEAEDDKRHRRRAALFYIAAQTECGHLCPVTMTHASVATLRHGGEAGRAWIDSVKTRDYDQRSLPRADKAGVTLGMGMTEKQGGTDVRANTTMAAPAGDGTWRLTGHKWFMSAPMSDAFLVTARTDAGLSCFLMPRILPDGQANMIRFQRLKDKLGNRSNASSEAEFEGAHATLVGEDGRGIATILEMVTLTRLDCSLASAGLMRSGLAKAVHHARYRQAFGANLIHQPLMQRVLADMALDSLAAAVLSMRVAEAFDRGVSDDGEAAYARIMTPAAKYLVCKMAPAFLYEIMECVGGNGYVEDSGLPRLYREAPVNAIWEGPGNVMALDLIRVLARGKDVLGPVLETLRRDLGDAGVAAVDRLRATARAAADDPGEARRFAEQLALAAAAAALQRDLPGPVADAYAATRLEGSWRATYGMLDDRFGAAAIVDAVCPAVG